jgi:hypothetical protein
LEKRNPKSGKHKTTRKNEIPNWENIKPLGKTTAEILTVLLRMYEQYIRRLKQKSRTKNLYLLLG